MSRPATLRTREGAECPVWSYLGWSYLWPPGQQDVGQFGPQLSGQHAFFTPA